MDIKKRFELIKEVGEEIISEEELMNLLKTKKKIIAYDGFEPSGRIHIAQGLQRAITVNKLTSAGIHFKFWIADWFAMLNNKVGGDLGKIRIVGEYFIEVWKASGMDLKKVEFIWASDFIKQNPEYWETVMKLSMNASVQRVLRCGQIMGRQDSSSNPSAQIMYPLMQAADIYHLKADIAQLGMDQRKVNMLARDLFPKLGFKPPVALHHHMLLGLKAIETSAKGIDRKIDMKMSKSNPSSAIFMDDTSEEVFSKFKKAYCPEGQEEENPVLEYAQYIVFEKFDEVVVKRDEKFGGDIIFKNYEELKDAFVSKKLHPLDLKNTIAKYIDLALDPVRDHFKKNKRAKRLQDAVKGFEVTR